MSYRPFCERFFFFFESRSNNKYKNLKVPKSYRPRIEVMQHLDHQNLVLLLPRQLAKEGFYHVFISKLIPEMCVISNRTKEQNVAFPLYLYSQTRTPNLNPEILKEISTKLGLKFAPDHEIQHKTPSSLARRAEDLMSLNLGGQIHEILEPCRLKDDEGGENFTPPDLLDYIYAILHSPNYREKYKEFLKIDFPRVPYPQDQNSFWQLVKLGGSLRKIHLLESEISEKLITTYPADGDNKVEKISYESGKVKINQTQYFEGVAPNVWEFFIGGYQPAQKWLKDRKGRILGFEEILHYQKIIAALSETDRLMKEVDLAFKF